jgi:hypothetical protein
MHYRSAQLEVELELEECEVLCLSTYSQKYESAIVVGINKVIVVICPVLKLC